MKIFFYLIVGLTYSYALVNNQKVILDHNQEKLFREHQKEKEISTTHYESEELKIDSDKYEEKCVQINEINIDKSSIFSKKLLDELKQPYLNNCNGIKKLNNLTKQISNMYIREGYATSRAYLKAQDLSDGIVNISILEGRISKVIGTNVYTKNTYIDFDEQILNLRDLEVGIQQHERLKSKKVNLELKPSSEVGYTDVHVVAEDLSSQFYGSFNISNNTTGQTGKYPIYLSLNYENLFGINDMIALAVNTSNNAFKSTNNSLGDSISYSFPYGRAYISFLASKFSYKQTILDSFGDDVVYEGSSDSYGVNYEYKLYHQKNHALDFDFNLNKTETKTYVNDVYIDLQSYIVTKAEVSLKHTYDSGLNFYYSIFKIHKGLNILGAKESTDRETDFIKYTIDLFYAKYFEDSLNPRFQTTIHFQYSDSNDFATEQIGVGGPYSVRGFKDGGLSGFTGGYARNELGITKELKGVAVSPYLGLDFGYVKNDENAESGNITGGAIGSRFDYKSSSLDIYYTKALKHTQETKKTDSSFFSVSYSYNF